MLKIDVLFGTKSCYEHQTKSFKDEDSAVLWIMRNNEKIMAINNIRIYGIKMTSFDVMAILRTNSHSERMKKEIHNYEWKEILKISN